VLGYIGGLFHWGISITVLRGRICGVRWMKKGLIGSSLLLLIMEDIFKLIIDIFKLIIHDLTIFSVLTLLIQMWMIVVSYLEIDKII
jgi:hypothetical protein